MKISSFTAVVFCLLAFGCPNPSNSESKINFNGITLDILNMQLMTGGSPVTLTAKTLPETDSHSFVWSSSDPAVATVSQAGVVTPQARGSAILTVQAVDTSITAACSITVYDSVTYSGNLTLPIDSVYWKQDKTYIHVSNLETGYQTQTSVASDGSFSIQDTQGTSPFSNSLVYVYCDVAGSRKFNDLENPCILLLQQNNKYSNDTIKASFKRIYGKISTPDPSPFTFSDAMTKPVIRIIDQSYWASTVCDTSPDGSFSFFVTSGHMIDAVLWSIGNKIEKRSDYQTYLQDPVRLFEPLLAAGSDELEIFGQGGTGTPLGLHKIAITYSCTSNLSAYPLFVHAGQNPMPIPLYDENGNQLTGVMTDSASATFYFRDFWRTSENSGSYLSDAFIAPTGPGKMVGWGAFFQVRLFVDTNRSGIIDPADPQSSAHYYGSQHNSAAPEYSSDYDEYVSPSYIMKDISIDLGAISKL